MRETPGVTIAREPVESDPVGPVRSLIKEAVGRFAPEFETLRFLPEARYDRRHFPTIGQYDWLAGQVLYALVRMRRPRRVIEFSTSSGYSTTFIALALKRNGTGQLHSIDLDRDAQLSAERWLRQHSVMDRVTLHQGDCRDVVPNLVTDELDLLFIDSLHSFDLTSWYLTAVVPTLQPEVLVHIHDVMPSEARVRIHGGPPFAAEEPRARPPAMHLLKRFVWLLLHGKNPNPFPEQAPREILPLDSLDVYAPSQTNELPTIDGNYFEEAVLVRELFASVSGDDAVYLHRLEKELAISDAQRYAAEDRIQRSDRWGRALEWNDALWCRAGTLQRVAPRDRVRQLIAELRRRHYGRRAVRRP